ncbi:MAG TPA: hypothetical protein PKC79_09385 [Solidesulfovibrio magneticus]|nr:hypothetical protein [Solidesulfovibrio magneticus]
MKILILFILSFAINQSTAFATETNDVYIAMKRMEAATQSGISYKDFGKEMIDLQLAVNLFNESKSSGNNPSFTEQINRAFKYYKLSDSFWKYYITNGYKSSPGFIMKVSEPAARELITLFPDESKSSEDGGFYFKEKNQIGSYRYVDNKSATSYLWREAIKTLAAAKEAMDSAEKPNPVKKNKKK